MPEFEAFFERLSTFRPIVLFNKPAPAVGPGPARSHSR